MQSNWAVGGAGPRALGAAAIAGGLVGAYTLLKAMIQDEVCSCKRRVTTLRC